MQFLCHAVGRHMELVLPELDAVASMYGQKILTRENPIHVGRFFLVEFENLIGAVSIVSRCVLIQGLYRVIDNQLANSVTELFSYYETNYPSCIDPTNIYTQLDIKAINKRLRNAREKEKLLDQFIHLDLERLREIQSIPQDVSLLIGENRCGLGCFLCAGLTPSSGGRAGRVGSGIASTFSLSQRPYNGVTTMDPELAFVMANLARVKQGDFILDPFAGSCGILLTCSYFGMGMGFAYDISRVTLMGEGPGRDIHANFSAYNFSSPEICLSDVRAPMWRQSFRIDSIVCDPPYGIRTFGGHTMKDFNFDDQFISELINTWSPYVIDGGRLVFYVCTLPNQPDALSSYLTPLLLQNRLVEIAIVESSVHVSSESNEAEWSRSLVVLQKQGEFIPQQVKSPEEPPTSQYNRNLPWSVCRMNTPFDVWRAAWVGDISSIEQFILKGGDAHQKDEHGKTPLYFASGYNKTQVVKCLLNGGDINAMDEQGQTALIQATRHGHGEIVSILLKGGANPNLKTRKHWFPAYFAATYGHSNVIQCIYEHSKDSLLLSGPGDATILHRAAECGHLETVKIILDLVPELKRKLDWMGRSYVSYAAKCGHLNVIKTETKFIPDKYGNTPLHEAVRYGRVKCVEYFLETSSHLNKYQNSDNEFPFNLIKTLEMQNLFYKFEINSLHE